MSKKEMINLLHLISLSGAKHYKLPSSVTYREDDNLAWPGVLHGQEIRGQAKTQAKGDFVLIYSRLEPFWL